MKPYYADGSLTLHAGRAADILASLPDQSVACAVTSPPLCAYVIQFLHFLVEGHTHSIR